MGKAEGVNVWLNYVFFYGQVCFCVRHSHSDVLGGEVCGNGGFGGGGRRLNCGG